MLAPPRTSTPRTCWPWLGSTAAARAQPAPGRARPSTAPPRARRLPAESRPSKVMSKALRAAFHRLLHRWPARVGRCGRAHSGALACAGLPAVTVGSAVSPKRSQLASGASHPRGAPLADLRAVRRALAGPRAFAPGVAGTTAPCLRLDVGERPVDGERVTCATYRMRSVARRAGYHAEGTRRLQLPPRPPGEERRDVREVYRPGAAGGCPGSGRGQDGEPQLPWHWGEPAPAATSRWGRSAGD